jgi:uncharacterized glyoxalase superfamily protein PhnB
MATKARSYKPDRLHNLTPHLVVRGAEAAIDWYQKAFGAELLARSAGPGGRLMHVEMRLGDSVLMMADEFPEMGSSAPPTLGGSPVVLQLFVPDVDAVYARALAVGATGTMPPADMFWGDRYAKLTDPFGHHWALATQKEELTFEEMDQRGKAWMAELAAAGSKP